MLYRGGRRREGPRGPPVWGGLWPTTQYITANENESSFDAVPAKWRPSPRAFYAEQPSIMQDVSWTTKRSNVPDCWQAAALSKFGRRQISQHQP